ncbi:MAG: hypothetical protein IPJ30_10580 [Acidobacteria bacterium]|nr:hypothetical protein [Acidobacteriota bacterium]
MKIAIRAQIAVVVFLLTLSSVASSQSKKPATVRLEGAVKASVNSLIIGAGIGPHYYSYIFAATRIGKKKFNDPPLIRLVYRQFQMDKFPERDFYELGERYRLKAIRDTTCDSKPADFGYEQFGDDRVSVMKLVDDRASDMIDEAAVLDCYTFTMTEFKRLP